MGTLRELIRNEDLKMWEKELINNMKSQKFWLSEVNNLKINITDGSKVNKQDYNQIIEKIYRTKTRSWHVANPIKPEKNAKTTLPKVLLLGNEERIKYFKNNSVYKKR